jgi:cation diffusion facilitator family transporter
MHSHSIERWTHSHAFLGERHQANERRTWLVVALTLAMMAAEIAGGTVFGSLALVADGWHMSTHAAALAIAALAYVYARRHAHDARFAFGTGKLGDLAGYTSAVILAMIALLIGYESVLRLLRPVPIAYGEAVAIAALGLAVNLASAWLLRDSHDHDHGHHHGHGHGHDHEDHGHERDEQEHPAPVAGIARDLNLRAAYVHVLADAATSVLAIVGLLTAWAFGWRFMDPIVSLVGSAVIASWAWGLVRDTGRVLLDAAPGHAGLRVAVRERLEREGDRVTDLHLWQVGPGHLAAIVALVSDAPQPPSAYKARLTGLPGLSHVTVEVEPCLRRHMARAG